MDTLGPDIFGHSLLQYRGFPLSEVKNVLVTPVGTKIFVLIIKFFYCVLNSVGLLGEAPLYEHIYICKRAYTQIVKYTTHTHMHAHTHGKKVYDNHTILQ